MRPDHNLKIANCRLLWVLLVLLVALPAMWVSAQGQAGGKTETPNGGASSVRASDGPDLYDIDVSGADVRFVLEALARRSGANIVVSPDIEGQVNAHLKQMSVDAILDYLSTVQGFKWRRSDGTYLVASKERLDKPAPFVEPSPPVALEILVWECRYIRPSDLTAMIEKLFPTLKIAEGPNSVTPMLTGTQTSLSSSDSGAASTGSSYSSSTSANNRSAVILIGDPSEIAKARQVLTKLDVRRPQVFIEVMITEIKSSFNKSVGIEWSWNDMVLSESTPRSGVTFGKFTKQGMTITGAVSALIENGDARLLAQPNIAVLDGECANILIGDKILYPRLDKKDIYGNATYEITELPIGISLQIAPKVTSNDEMVLTLYPQVSLITKYLKFLGGEYPQISTREARTTVSVRNGTTLAIGGLMRDEDVKNASKVPFLGDLPLFGQLFRHMKTTKDRTEIVIFITPKIMDEGKSSVISGQSSEGTALKTDN